MEPLSQFPDHRLAFRRAIAEWTLARRPMEDLPNAALDALVAGMETPTLAQLAAMQGASWSEIRPLAERVVEELGGPLSEQDAKLLVADAWLERVAGGASDPAAEGDLELTEILWGLGGAYEWFRLAICDLEVLDALEDEEARRRAVDEMRARATEVLAQPVERRLAARAPTLEERPFLPVRPRRWARAWSRLNRRRQT